MSTTKNAMIRYKVLDSCFRNIGRRYFINDLINECGKALLAVNEDSSGIGRTQLYKDIRFMESPQGWNVELRKGTENKKAFYRYEDPNFSINNSPLTELQVSQLEMTIDLLKQFKGLPQFEWIEDLFDKLLNGLPKKNTFGFIEFDNNQYLTGINYLGDLYSAILYKKVLGVKYKPFDADESYEVVLHPYFLKQYNNRWFLFGFNQLNNLYSWNLALDRIQSVKELENAYVESDINWETYFEDLIGVTKPLDAEKEEVILHVYGNTANYIITKPLHESQKKPRKVNETVTEIRIEVVLNRELENVLMSYANNLEVIKPLILRDRIRERLVKAYKYYIEK